MSSIRSSHLLLSALFLCYGCQPQRESDCLSETYIHKYGVALPSSEWASRGQDGLIVATRKDGVTISRNYAAGVFNGETLYSYPYRDVIQKKELFLQGTLIQETFYSELGIPRQESTYHNDHSYSVQIWDIHGAPQAIENYVNNQLLNGTYYNPQHQVSSTVSNGKGLRMLYSPTGELEAQEEIHNGEVSSSKTYRNNGSLLATSTYQNGLLHGERRTYSEWGEPITIEQWEHGTQQGITVTFEWGEKISEIPYVAGRPHGIEKRYQNGEFLVQEVTWKDGIRHGPRKIYNNGQVYMDWFFQGELVPNKATFDVLSNK